MSGWCFLPASDNYRCADTRHHYRRVHRRLRRRRRGLRRRLRHHRTGAAVSISVYFLRFTVVPADTVSQYAQLRSCQHVCCCLLPEGTDRKVLAQILVCASVQIGGLCLSTDRMFVLRYGSEGIGNSSGTPRPLSCMHKDLRGTATPGRRYMYVYIYIYIYTYKYIYIYIYINI